MFKLFPAGSVQAMILSFLAAAFVHARKPLVQSVSFTTALQEKVEKLMWLGNGARESRHQ